MTILMRISRTDQVTNSEIIGEDFHLKAAQNVPMTPIALDITDEEAEKQLPRYALALKQYHQHRVAGQSPEAALKKTIMDWRTFWRAGAFVPHQQK